MRVGPIPLSAECCGDVEVAEDDDTVDRDVYEIVEAGGEFTGRGTKSGSTFAITENLLIETTPGVLFVFECEIGLGLSLMFDADNVLKGEYLKLKLTGGGPAFGRVGLGA